MTSDQNKRRYRSHGDYLCLADAASLIGNRIVNAWQDSDLESPIEEIDASFRKERVRSILRNLLSGGQLPAFGFDDEGAYDDIGRNLLSKPWFDIDLSRSLFLWAYDDWAPIFVSKTGLKAYLAGISDMKPRKAVTYLWEDITRTAWVLALESKELRETKRLIGAIQDAFMYKYDGKPEDKELRKMVDDIIHHLGDRVLSREHSLSETSPDTPPDSG